MDIFHYYSYTCTHTERSDFVYYACILISLLSFSFSMYHCVIRIGIHCKP